MLLSDYIARGFPGGLDAAIAAVGVGGVDRIQAQCQLRYCPETDGALYPPHPQRQTLKYEPDSRPVLEAIAARLGGGTARERAQAAMRWVNVHVVHPHHVDERVPPDRALSEEDIVASGAGWCNEQARVLISLCEVGGIAGRLCFVYHDNLRCGHTAVELDLDGRWAFFDPTFDVSVELPDGRLAEARELSGASRALAHQAYREPLAEYYEHCRPWVEDEPGWGFADRPSVEAGGDLLAYLGFTHYLIDGVTRRGTTAR
ncbi:transglutaminase-like domain-containing protein [Catenulispora pinisilvae]|uniref:transglutaminase-like domain-containing protein n=1 Tax=Catenulispora pinisilvae TaxID=2705253 RepID=UPI0018928447|nr:transglutaminase family protein [Catenulispora pinisilvae]